MFLRPEGQGVSLERPAYTTAIDLGYAIVSGGIYV